jgi:cellulose synthase (UDP-forming)
MKNSGLGISKHRVLSWKENVVLTLILTAGAFLTGAFGAYWFELSSIPHHFPGVWHAIDIILFILLTYVVWHQIVNEMFSWFLSLDMAKPKRLEPEANLRVAFLTAFVPGKEPYEVLENTLGAMIRCDYPHDTWLLDEGDDAMAKVICRKYGVKYFTRKNRPEYNLDRGPYMAKTKGGNYNAWYTEHSSMYDFVAQLDVDFEPKRDFLTKTLGYFRDPKIAFVGTPQIYGNQDKSWIARAAAEQAFSFYGIIQRGLFAKDMPLFIGANHVVRVTAHDDIGGYSGHIVEDHLTGMNFYANKWRSVYLPEVLAVGEGPATWDSYFSQQMRWAYGLIHILFTQSLQEDEAYTRF